VRELDLAVVAARALRLDLRVVACWVAVGGVGGVGVGKRGGGGGGAGLSAADEGHFGGWRVSHKKQV